VRGGDDVPWYRTPAAARLPVGGNVAALWRAPIAATLAPLMDDAFVVDLRSSDYAGLWRPHSGRVVSVRVLRRRMVGRKKVEQVISFDSKLAKGRLARALIDAAARRRTITDAQAVAKIAASLGFEPRPTKSGLDLIDTR